MSSTLRIKRGDTWRATFDWQDSDGNAIDLTGCSARLHLRKKPRQVEIAGTTYPVELDLTSPDGGITVTGSEGKVEVEATASQTKNLDPESHVTDLEITFPDGTVKSSQTIDVIVERDVTYD